MKQELFKYPPAEQQISNESSERYTVLEMGTDMIGESLLMRLQDGMYPLKGMVFTETIFGANMIKSIFIEAIKIFSEWYFLPGLLLTNKQKLLMRFNWISYKVLKDKIFKYKHWSKFGKAFYALIDEFMVEMKFNEKSSDQFAEILVFLIDCDNAYRLRIADLFTETSKRQLIENPRKEIIRLSKILEKRELCPSVVKKFTSITRILSLFLLLPKVKRAFRKAIEHSNYQDLCLDEGDIYWSCMRTDYQFMGMTFEERQKYAKLKGYKFPQQEKMKKINELQIQKILEVLQKANVGIQDYLMLQEMLRLLPEELPKIPDKIETK